MKLATWNVFTIAALLLAFFGVIELTDFVILVLIAYLFSKYGFSP
ncbi:MAG: hypothetical protein V1834_03095 [Candidatus Micrarchaeota archaeon]